MKATEMEVELTFVEVALGTVALDPLAYEKYIAAEHPDRLEEELGTLRALGQAEEAGDADGIERLEKPNVSGFRRLPDGTPIILDYMIKGMFKEFARALARVPGSRSSKIRAHQKEITGLIFAEPRQIRLELPEGGRITMLERPLRARTPQGERVAIAVSETVPAGTKVRFRLKVLKDDLIPAIEEWLDYGELAGFMQWRSSGCGRFTWRLVTDGAE